VVRDVDGQPRRAFGHLDRDVLVAAAAPFKVAADELAVRRGRRTAAIRARQGKEKRGDAETPAQQGQAARDYMRSLGSSACAEALEPQKTAMPVDLLPTVARGRIAAGRAAMTGLATMR